MADTKRELRCPACGKPMEKVYIEDAKINVDICTDGCGGIYFDNREFDKFNESFEDISKIVEKVENKEFQRVDDTEERTCPVCNAKMVKNTTAMNGEVVVDDCYTCGGKFLDNGELQKIRSEYSTDKERSEAVIACLYKIKGDELARVESAYQNSQHKSALQRLVLGLLGIK